MSEGFLFGNECHSVGNNTSVLSLDNGIDIVFYGGFPRSTFLEKKKMIDSMDLDELDPGTPCFNYEAAVAELKSQGIPEPTCEDIKKTFAFHPLLDIAPGNMELAMCTGDWLIRVPAFKQQICTLRSKYESLVTA